MLIVANVCFAREPRRGYRGFVEWDNSIGQVDLYHSATGETTRDADWLIGLATTHGYQINSHCFTGLGFMLSLSGWPTLMLPVYADFRYDVRFGKFTPYADAKIGYELTHPGIYFSSTIGYRINCGGKVNINLGLGMTVWGRTEEITKEGSFWDNPPHYGPYTVTKHAADILVSLRIGFDF